MQYARLVRFATVAVALVLGTRVDATPLTYGTYYDESSPASSCSGIRYCNVVFSQLPADKLLLIRKLHCQFATEKPVIGLELLISTTQTSATQGGSPLLRSLKLAVPATAPFANGGYWTSINFDTQWLVGQSRFPYVNVLMADVGSMSVDCTMIGDLVNPIQ